MESKIDAFGHYRLGRVLGATGGGTAWECHDGEAEVAGFLWIEAEGGSRATQTNSLCELHARVAGAFGDRVARLEVGIRARKTHVAVLFRQTLSEADLIAGWLQLRDLVPELALGAQRAALSSGSTLHLESALMAERARLKAEESVSIPTVPQSALPRSVGRYELIEEVGRGGMGIVCRARHPGLDQIVALKIVQIGPATSEETVQRFLREARLIASLKHPNIVVIHDVGSDGPSLYYAMDFLDGRTMAAWLETHPPIPDVLRVTEKVCRAIHYAHERGIVHRDMKPSNVILVEGLHPVITDFGLAKQVEDAAESGLTQSGRIFGTPHYMAPEQASGRTHEVTPAADVYAIGAILYQAVTGTYAHSADNLQELLARIVRDDPEPPSRRSPGVSPALEAAILRAMARAPEQRYPTALALADDLAWILSDSSSQAV